MTDILNQSIVVALDRNGHAINSRRPREAFCMMATNVTTALAIELGADGHERPLRPVTWDEWILLPNWERACQNSSSQNELNKMHFP